jgi:hypothetical protein
LFGAGAFLLGRMSRPKAATYRRLTFRQGTVQAARFTPDGESVVYSQALEGSAPEIFVTHPRSPESRDLGLKGNTLLSDNRTYHVLTTDQSRHIDNGCFGEYARRHLG